ncbi:hypothetical protein SLS62_002810 [Diatrype stigma]|uniref:Uncharacterized protein n=1 Tax=Diatrype stigma TaxID=117547 RepID=A0AAN9UTN4_9PEZI
MCKNKIMSGFFRAAISFNSSARSSKLPTSESDALFVEAIKMIEYDGLMYEHESLKGFRWYMMMQFPFPAYVCLLSGLRERTTGELCEKAWDAICQHHERRQIMGHLRTPLHVAFAPLFVKAWDAREAAEIQHGRTIAPPKLITLLRQRIASMPKRAKKSPVPEHGSRSVSVTTEGYAASGSVPPPPVPPPTAQQSQHPHQPGPELTASMGFYLNPDPFGALDGSGSMPRQFPAAFPELHFGGEMDWDYLFQEYSGFMVPPPPPPPPHPQYQQQQQQPVAQGVSAAAAAHDPSQHQHQHQQSSSIW